MQDPRSRRSAALTRVASTFCPRSSLKPHASACPSEQKEAMGKGDSPSAGLPASDSAVQDPGAAPLGLSPAEETGHPGEPRADLFKSERLSAEIMFLIQFWGVHVFHHLFSIVIKWC